MEPIGARRWIVVLLSLGALAAVPAARGQGLDFYTVAPCRVLDTRLPAEAFGGPALAGQGERAFTLAARCGVPTTALAVSANVTVTQPAAEGFLTLYPLGLGRPTTSGLNFRTGSTRANNMVLTLGTNAGVVIFGGFAGGSAQVILDVNGYFAAPPAVANQVDPPVFVPPPGSYSDAPKVQILSSTPGAVVRYTTDGSAPSRTSGTVYTGAITLSATATLRAIAYRADLVDSDPAAATYQVSNQPTLFVATLTPQGAAVSQGSGTASLLLAADGLSAVVRFHYANLSSPESSEHIHGPADPGQSGGVLFDLDTATPQADGSLLWTIAPVGTNTIADIVAAIRGGRTYINIHSQNYPSGEIRGQFYPASGSPSFNPPPDPTPPPDTVASYADPARAAARFLTQATYGPTTADLAALQAPGATFSGWLDQQFALPRVSHGAYLDAAAAAGEALSNNQFLESFWTQAVGGPDQLRQRVALALSEIFVVSDQAASLGNQPRGLATYLDLLERDAFGNARQLLEDVTLNPAMGVYLDMLGNDKEDPQSGQNPNENYAREILQLFSIGLYELHPDGSLKLDANGLPIATYNQDVVVGLAHVFTGWTFAGNLLPPPDYDYYRFYYPDENWTTAMEGWPDHHSTGSKLLLDGELVPPFHSPQQDLQQALDSIFGHPNAGPFLCRQLIQRLVTSNPSPAYVYRCARAFADDGHGVRGDMKTVLRAILLDYEARTDAPITSAQGFGKLREPIVTLAQFLRAFHAVAPSGKLRLWSLEDPIWGINQNPFRSPTVFNFFRPDYSQPGPAADAGLATPEFQIATETSIIGTANFLHDAAYYGVYGGYGEPENLLTPDYSALLPLADNPAALVAQLDLLLTARGMSSEMRGILTTEIQARIDAGDDAATRVASAIYLVLTSPEYAIQR